MSGSCPGCGSRVLEVSHSRSWKELFDVVGFSRHMRCRDCKHRFVGNTFDWSDLLFARCPRCHRMDLNRWFKEHLRPRGWMAFVLKMGGYPYRCEYCRVNFVSMRRRKEHFTFDRWRR